VTGTEWNVVAVRRVVDGDTVHIIRSRDAQLGDDWFHIAEVKPKSIRLVWVDTPERGQPGYREATADLIAWIQERGPARVICYESAGWDRLLGDLIDNDGNSASQYLMTERGWPAYQKGA
jgi:endonuclease YncB( thermonuclease family)